MILKHAPSTALVALMGAATFFVLDNAEPWAGDWVGPVWVCMGFFTPFLAGLAAGRVAFGRTSYIAGATFGIATVVLPSLFYFGTGERGHVEHQMWVFFAAFIPLAAVQGAITMPVGVGVRLRGRDKDA